MKPHPMTDSVLALGWSYWVKVSEALLAEVFPWQPLESQVKLSVEEVRRDDLNLDQFAAKAEQGNNGQIEVRNISWAW